MEKKTTFRCDLCGIEYDRLRNRPTQEFDDWNNSKPDFKMCNPDFPDRNIEFKG